MTFRWFEHFQGALFEERLVDMPPTAIAVYAAILAHANKGEAIAYPSQERLGKLLGTSERNVRRSIEALAGAGLLILQRSGEGRGHNLKYRFPGSHRPPAPPSGDDKEAWAPPYEPEKEAQRTPAPPSAETRKEAHRPPAPPSEGERGRNHQEKEARASGELLREQEATACMRAAASGELDGGNGMHSTGELATDSGRLTRDVVRKELAGLGTRGERLDRAAAAVARVVVSVAGSTTPPVDPIQLGSRVAADLVKRARKGDNPPGFLVALCRDADEIHTRAAEIAEGMAKHARRQEEKRRRLEAELEEARRVFAGMSDAEFDAAWTRARRAVIDPAKGTTLGQVVQDPRTDPRALLEIAKGRWSR